MALDPLLTHWHAWRAAPGICGPHVDIDLEGVLFVRFLVIHDRRQFLAVAWFFTCGTPMASDAGTAALTGKRDIGAAKRLIAEAGYKGEPIVVLDGVDLPASHAHGLIAADLLKKLRFNVQLASSDWGTVVTRRASKKPVAEDGWNVFGTDFLGAEMLYSWLNPPLPANDDKAWFGWSKDDEIEALQKAWLKELKASDSEVRQEIAAEIQERAFGRSPSSRPNNICPRPPTGKPVRRHQGGGLVYVERRESLARSSAWPRRHGARQ